MLDEKGAFQADDAVAQVPINSSDEEVVQETEVAINVLAAEDQREQHRVDDAVVQVPVNSLVNNEDHFLLETIKTSSEDAY